MHTQTRADGDAMSLRGRETVVVGLARSGTAAARYLLSHGARVVATDAKPREALGPEALALEPDVRLELGGHRRKTLLAASLVVVSPGVPWDLPELVAARTAGVEVIAELELACRALPGPLVAVTGTKGKSTTTSAIGALLAQGERKVRVGGNIGTPAISLVEGAGPETVFVLEVSSFQLEGTHSLHPDVAVFLNLSDDHLDRHGSREVYASAKARIFQRQTSQDWAVVNGADPRVVDLARHTAARTVLFAAEPLPHPEVAFFQDRHALLRRDGQEERLFVLDDLRLPGAHLALDVLAAATVARLMDVPLAAIRAAAQGFEGAEHVLELVAEIGSVRYYNDSKATNVAAAVKSLEAFSAPVVAIMGGRFKGGDLSRLAAAAGRAKRVLLIGESRSTLAEALGEVAPLDLCASLPEAVARAQAAASPGDVVLLAPACASFDMFVDYAERGRAFKAEVGRLRARNAAGRCA